MTKLTGIVFSSLLLLMSPHLALSKTDRLTHKTTVNKLKDVRNSISSLKTNFDKNQTKLNGIQARLKKIELSMSVENQKLQRTKVAINKTKSKIADFQLQERALDKKIQWQLEKIKEQLQTQFVLGNSPPLKLILNQADRQHFGRMMGYFDYFNQARVTSLNDYQASVKKQKILNNQLTKKQRQQTDLYQVRERKTEQLKTQYETRSLLVSSLKKNLKATSVKLKEYQKDESRLALLVKKLETALADIPNALINQQKFKNSRGDLPWPTLGKVTNKYGDKRSGSKMRWNGIIIAGPEGQQVTSVHSGRVAYADWLRGFGLLIIVDHGDDFMTLYAHNQSLYRDIGDWVETGDMIAAIGRTGGAEQTGLYFEIRQKGIPTNPFDWIASNNRLAQRN